MKPEVTALPGFEDVDFSQIKKEGKSMPDISPPATFHNDYAKHVKDAKPNSSDYKKYTMEDVRAGEAQNKFNVISTFAGGGGSSTGYRLAGGKILCINEFVKEARNTYHENYPNTPILPDDIKKLKGQILTIGITNQRETTIMWDSVTGKPVYNAIVWQDRRTADFCNKFKSKKRERIINRKTGLLIDPYFSGTKIKWIIDNVLKAKKLLKKKQLLFGTVDTFLLWRLTKGLVHATDATNASRTMLYNITTNSWDNQILKSLKIPTHILPIIKDSSDNFGATHKSITGRSYPITGVVGDQQAATIGQCCFEKGSVKSTYGTGAFILMNTGNKKIYSKNRLLTTVCYRLNGKSTYA